MLSRRYVGIDRSCILRQFFGSASGRIEKLPEDTKKRNNAIDILKAGGTRMSLFLLFKNKGLLVKSQKNY